MHNNISERSKEILKLYQEYQKEPLRSRKLFLLTKMEQNAIEMQKNFEPKPTPLHINKQSLCKRLHVDPQQLEEALSRKDINQHYKPTRLVKISNLFFEPLASLYTKLFPHQYNSLHKTLLMSGLKVLSISYISLTIFFTFITFFITLALGAVMFYSINIYYSLIFCLVITTLVFLTIIIYPRYKIRARKKQLEKELPFIITHLAAASNSGMQNLKLFESLVHTKYYPCIKSEAIRIINYVTIFGYSLESVLQNMQTPSMQLKDFFRELATAKNQKTFLNNKSKSYITKYKLKVTNINKYFNIYNEVKQTTHQVKFNPLYILAIFLAIAILTITFLFFFDFNTYKAEPFFYITALLSIIIAWAPFFIDTYTIFKRNKELETEFYKFIKDLKTSHLEELRGKDYRKLTKNVEKLINQYKMGIPMDRALNTFAGDTRNPLIESVVAVAIKNKTNLYETMNQMTSSKILRNIITTEKSF